ncbi:MFS transporter [Candidatus Mycobacterium methanotrophicum]|uniref:MFS transporter n=1 Tax=Candidatus Mycobacterium methanotrophicum TaxID=2943498 RepID=A0ABY4QLB1_9MYCO|nr:MFS transporter [Candidatus Mycobacterium methanotrophicum]UQX10450.1 MFS transporter [Candidatus Mycobacterium methanotrophicum]
MPIRRSEPASTGIKRRWLSLAVTLAVTSCAFLFINCGVFLIPALQTDRHTSLTEAGLLSAMPSFGMVLTLVAWGYLVDRIGERMTLTVGSALIAVAAFAAAPLHSLPAIGALLFVGGMAAASANVAGGRLVSGSFPPQQRGLAMGIRQTAQPLGVAIGAVAMPELTEIENGFFAALLYPAIACAVAALVSWIFLADPPRPKRTVAVACFVALLILALNDQLDSPLAEAAMVVAAVVAVGYNGLAATAITEYAGPFWSGRALGAQNTAQRLMAANRGRLSNGTKLVVLVIFV